MPDGRFEIRVEDRGIGVDAGDIENVFEPFWQAKSPLRSADEGIGLGLSIVRQLMDLHGGKVAMWLRDDGERPSVCCFKIGRKAVRRSKITSCEPDAGH